MHPTRLWTALNSATLTWGERIVMRCIHCLLWASSHMRMHAGYHISVLARRSKGAAHRQAAGAGATQHGGGCAGGSLLPLFFGHPVLNCLQGTAVEDIKTHGIVLQTVSSNEPSIEQQWCE